MERKNDDKAAHYHTQLSISKEPEESQSPNTSDDDDDNDDDDDDSEITKEQAPNEESHPQSQSQSSPNFDSDDNSEESSSEERETCPRNLEEEGSEDEMYLMILFKLVHKGDWGQIKHFLELHPDALSAKISSYGETALHIAALSGHVKIVEELVNMTSVEDLKLINDYGETALSLAAGSGITRVAKPLVRKNHDLLGIKNINGVIPVVVAAQFGHTDMVHFLYYMTQEEDLDPETSSQGAKLLITCIVAQIYDIALDLVLWFPELATAVLEGHTGGTLNTLATRNSAFPSRTQLVCWKKWIYSCMPVHSSRVSNIHRDIEAYPGIHTYHENIIKRALRHSYGLVWDLLKLLVPYIKHIYVIKLKHAQVLELLDCISQHISALNHSQIKDTELFQAVFNAIKHGNVEFVEEILTAYPDIIWIVDEDMRNIFLYAVLQRQEKIFTLLHKMGPKKNIIATSLDKDSNTILHHAAMLSPSSHLDGISGAALQMQRELQWFEEVEKVVQPMYREIQNNYGKTARALFTSEHKNLRRAGEKWMKETSTSCTVVAALIATVMFTAIFTVPGGYDGTTGNPLYLHQNSFMVFIVSDALSLFTSSSSVLLFLGILKSRYTEDEFLMSLPRKLIMGIASLFFSIATMMLTFGTTIFISLHDRLSWISIPIILLSSIPVMVFVFPQVPLLYEIFVSTYGPGIFKKPKKG
ncbi:hypothetical protein CsSME_00040188 [Camellia sinensis var. sinensis]